MLYENLERRGETIYYVYCQLLCWVTYTYYLNPQGILDMGVTPCPNFAGE